MQAFTSYMKRSSEPDRRPDDEMETLERKKATTQVLLEIIQGIELTSNLSAEHPDKKLQDDMEFLFSIMNQYKFIFPFNSSRLYEVCIFKKLLLRVREMEQTTHDVFSINHLLYLVIRWHEKDVDIDNGYILKLKRLLHQINNDVQELNSSSKLAFKESLNLNYLHRIFSETGKHHLKQIEQEFQDNWPQQAIVSIQTNHYLYNYLEMLQKIWCDIVEVPPICTWPAFNSTMQMHHNMLERFEEWKSQCEEVEKEYTKKNDTDEANLKLLDELTQEINSIITHMDPQKGSKSLKYAGKYIERIMSVIMNLRDSKEKKLRDLKDDDGAKHGHFDVYKSYFHAKLNDNHDQARQIFILDSDLSFRIDDVKRYTKMLLIPSAYHHHLSLNVPTQFYDHVNNVFTVNERGSVILNRDPICQEIITWTLNNFGINLRQDKDINTVEAQNQCRSSLGIIGNSDSNKYLPYFMHLHYHKDKAQGSWDITRDMIESIPQGMHEAVNATNSLNMFFEDDPLGLPPHVRKYLLEKFILHCFFEFCPPLDAEGLSTTKIVEMKSVFERNLMSARWDSCERIARIMSTKTTPITANSVFKTVYGDLTIFEAGITMKICAKDPTEKTETTEQDIVKKRSWFDFAKESVIKTQEMIKRLMQTGTKVSQDMKDETMPGKQFLIDIEEKRKEYFKRLDDIQNQADDSDKNASMQNLLEDANASYVNYDRLLLIYETEIESSQLEIRKLQNAMDKLTGADKDTAEKKLEAMVDKTNQDQEIFKKVISELNDLGVLVSFIEVKSEEIRESVVDNAGGEETAGNMQPRQVRDLVISNGDNSPAITTSQSRDEANDSSVGSNDGGGNGGAPPTLRSDTSTSATAPMLPVSELGSFGTQNARIGIGSDSNTANGNIQTSDLPDLEHVLLGSSAATPVKSERSSSPMNPSAGAKQAKPVFPEMDSRKAATLAGTPAPTPAPSAAAATLAPTPAPAAAAETERENPANAQLKPIAPIDKILAYSHDTLASYFTDLIIDETKIAEFWDDIGLPPQQIITEAVTHKSQQPKDYDFKTNMTAFYAFYTQNKDKFEFTGGHVFVVVHSTTRIASLAKIFLRVLGNNGVSPNKIQQACGTEDFKRMQLPTWVNDTYVDSKIKKLKHVTLDQNSRTQEEILNLQEFDYFKGVENQERRLKVKFLLLLELLKSELAETADKRKTELNKETARNTQKVTRGLFTQPSAWCDDSADDSPPESARVCCRCGRCPDVVQNAQKTGLLAYGTAPPTHPFLYPAPSRLVFAAAPMHGMVPGTQAQQVYILRL